MQVKLAASIESINKLAARLSPIDEEVKAEIRRTADRVVRRAHHHSKFCPKEHCTLNITDRPQHVIASKCFIFCIEKMCNEGGVSGVTKQTLTNLHQRVQASHVFNSRDNQVQHEGCAAAVATVDSEDFCVEQPCQQAKPAKREREEEAKVALKRVSSGGLDDAAQASKLTRIRDAIAASNAGFSAKTRAEAIRLLAQRTQLTAELKAEGIARGVDEAGVAHILMLAIATERKNEPGSSVPLALVDGVDAHALVAEMRKMLPEGVDDEDDLF